MLQNSLVLIDQKTFPDSDFVLIDSEHSSKSSFSKLSDEHATSNQNQDKNQDTPSINYTINSPTSPNSFKKYSENKKKNKRGAGFRGKLKTSLSINESFQDPVVDSRFNIGDLSAIEYRSNMISNSGENTNANNSFITGEDLGIFMIESGSEKESGSSILKELILGMNYYGIKQKISQNNILSDNFTIIWNVLKSCSEKTETQKCLLFYILHLFRENLLRNEVFEKVCGFGAFKEKIENMKFPELTAFGLTNYGIRMDLDLVKASLREEAISFLFKVKNLQEKQNLMNILMSA